MGSVHRQGIMRLATARDELVAHKHRHVQAYTEYLMLVLLSQVVNQEPRRKRTGYRSRFAPEPQIRIASPRASPQSSGEYVPYSIQLGTLESVSPDDLENLRRD